MAESPSSRFIDREESVLFLLIVAGFVGGLLAASEVPNLDDAWLLIATGRFMDGAVIGRDLFELNPPLIYWLMTPAVWLSRHLGSDDYTTYCLWVGLLAASASFLTFKVMIQAEISIAHARLATLVSLALFVFVSGADYGQRDPLAYELSAPFLISEALGATGRRTSSYVVAPIAVLAAIGFLIKPYMALVPAALFTWRIIRERKITAIISPDAIIMLVIAAAYVTYVVAWTPGYLELARLVMIAYPAYDSTPVKLLISYAPVILVSLLLWRALARTSHRRTAAAVSILLLTTMAFMLGSLTQLKGWYYHLLPCYLALCGACIIYLVLQPRGVFARPFPRLIALAFPTVLVIFGMTRASYFQRGTVLNWDIAKVISNSGGGPFLAISSSMWGIFPAVNEMGVEWASRSEAQWMVPATIKLSQGTPRQREHAEELRAFSSRLIAADLRIWKPQTVAVKAGLDQAISQPFDWISFFSRNQEFANLWSSYCAEGRTGEWDIYRRCKD